MDAPVHLFHMGGDEVNFPCWGKDSGIIRWLEDNGYNTNPEINSEGYMRLWSDFQVLLDVPGETYVFWPSFHSRILVECRTLIVFCCVFVH